MGLRRWRPPGAELGWGVGRGPRACLFWGVGRGPEPVCLSGGWGVGKDPRACLSAGLGLGRGEGPRACPSVWAQGMIALRRGATELTHEDYMEGILEVQAKKKANLQYYA